MYRIKIPFLLLGLLFALSACIEEYRPELDQEDTSLYVIDGRITDLNTLQTIKISRSSEIYNPKYYPASGCDVRIIDGNGAVYDHISDSAGVYLVDVPLERLAVGNSFKLEVVTPESEVLVSSWDTLRDCPPLENVYYLLDEFPTDLPGESQAGIQFYVDYAGEGSSSTEVKYEIEETWQYEMEYPIENTWDGRRLLTYDPPIWDYSVCWRTVTSDQYYTLSTEIFTTNRYDQFPLHYIPSRSFKLFIGYSLLVRQLTLSDSAKFYFDKLGGNILENGGLYQTQPQQVRGNMINVTNRDKRVLGYFYAAMGSEKRIFIDDVPEMEIDYFTLCSPVKLDLGYGLLRNPGRLLYILFADGIYLLPDECVDCRSLGGNTQKPDFWPA